MKLDMEVGLGPDHIGSDGDPAPPKRDTAAQFSAHVRCRQTAGWIKMPLGTEVDLVPGLIVLDGDLAPSESYTAAPSFQPVSLVAKQSPISANAQLLLKFVLCLLIHI